MGVGSMGMTIENLNEEIRNCTKCRLFETRRNAVCGEGNVGARIMIIAQAPGKNEDKEGRMFIGPSGKVLDELLGRIGIDRDEVYMTNLIKCMLPEYRRPRGDEIEACSRYLDREVELVDPKVLVPLGYYSTRYLFQKYNIPYDPREFSNIYGKLILGDNTKILPLRHPATILYQNQMKRKMMENYRKMKVLLTDCKWYRACPMRRYFKQGRLERRWIELYCKGDWQSCVRYHLEERGEPHPDWMLPNGTVDEDLGKETFSKREQDRIHYTKSPRWRKMIGETLPSITRAEMSQEETVSFELDNSGLNP